MNHYVYKIEYTTNKGYIGCRSCLCDPADDTAYIGSSRHTPNDKIKVKKVLKVFSTREMALAYESFLHKLRNVAVNENFYNQAVQTSTKFSSQGLTAKDCKWVADKAKKRIHDHQKFATSVYEKHGVFIEYLSEYNGSSNPIMFKCPSCDISVIVNKASNHKHGQIMCKVCAKDAADKLQKTLVGSNRTDKQKEADLKRKTYTKENQTTKQLEGRVKAAKTATGQKVPSRGKPGTASMLFKPWYYITPEGEYHEMRDTTITQFIENSNGEFKRGSVFHATSAHCHELIHAGELKGYTFGFLPHPNKNIVCTSILDIKPWWYKSPSGIKVEVYIPREMFCSLGYVENLTPGIIKNGIRSGKPITKYEFKGWEFGLLN